MAELDSRAVVARSEHAIAERVFEETVLLDPNTDRYTRLNRSGGVLWDALEQPTGLAALAERLQAEFGVDAERARADVNAFIRQLDERGLIERRG